MGLEHACEALPLSVHDVKTRHGKARGVTRGHILAPIARAPLEGAKCVPSHQATPEPL